MFRNSVQPLLRTMCELPEKIFCASSFTADSFGRALKY